MVWMQPCLTPDLLREFGDLWHRFTAPCDDRRSRRLRVLDGDELVQAVDDLGALSNRTVVATAQLLATRSSPRWLIWHGCGRRKSGSSSQRDRQGSRAWRPNCSPRRRGSVWRFRK